MEMITRRYTDVAHNGSGYHPHMFDYLPMDYLKPPNFRPYLMVFAASALQRACRLTLHNASVGDMQHECDPTAIGSPKQAPNTSEVHRKRACSALFSCWLAHRFALRWNHHAPVHRQRLSLLALVNHTATTSHTY